MTLSPVSILLYALYVLSSSVDVVVATSSSPPEGRAAVAAATASRRAIEAPSTQGNNNPSATTTTWYRQKKGVWIARDRSILLSVRGGSSSSVASSLTPVAAAAAAVAVRAAESLATPRVNNNPSRTTTTWYRQKKGVWIARDRSIVLSVRGGASSPSPPTTNVDLFFSRGGGDESVSAISQRTTTSTALSLGLGALAGLASWRFAQWFPFFITPKAAPKTYIPANYRYQADLDSRFCESAWTIYTDYGLGLVMTLLAIRIFRSGATATIPVSPRSRQSYEDVRRLRNLCTTLLVMYAVQFTVAGVLHQFKGSLEQRNTLVFRLAWTIVVTMVSASGGVIGAIGSALARGLLGFSYLPSPEFWRGYTGLMVGLTALGKLSYQRPAADTFIAGTSQALSTFFAIAMVFLVGNKVDWPQPLDLRTSTKARCVLGFLLNSALLPGYALALYKKPDISMGLLNTVMHSWLLLCYTLQGLSLAKIVEVAAYRARFVDQNRVRQRNEQ